MDKRMIVITKTDQMRLLGHRVGDTVEWYVHAGPRSIEIFEIMYQPEAVGNDHL